MASRSPELEHGLENKSGLLGLCERSRHVHELEAMVANDDRALARTIYVRRIVQAVASIAVSLGGIDAMVFTGGVGEHSFWVREHVCAELAFLGVALDGKANVSAWTAGEHRRRRLDNARHRRRATRGRRDRACAPPLRRRQSGSREPFGPPMAVKVTAADVVHEVTQGTALRCLG
jgi:Acetokinase family